MHQDEDIVSEVQTIAVESYLRAPRNFSGVCVCVCVCRACREGDKLE